MKTSTPQIAPLPPIRCVMSPRPGRLLSGRRAFTLVEVVLALGILSFGLVAMMGLLSAGIQTFRDAVDSSAEARIAQHLATQLSQADFSKIKTADEDQRFFTREGLELTGASAQRDAVYSATISSPEKLQLPGMSDSAQGNVLTFVISISTVSDRKPKLFPIQVANYGS